MNEYTIYEEQTGRIVMSGFGSTPPEQLEEGHKLLMSRSNPDTQYVDGGQIQDRPEFSISIESIDRGFLLTNIPERTEARINELSNVIDDGFLELTSSTKQKVALFLKKWPYINWFQQISVG